MSKVIKTKNLASEERFCNLGWNGNSHRIMAEKEWGKEVAMWSQDLSWKRKK